MNITFRINPGDLEKLDQQVRQAVDDASRQVLIDLGDAAVHHLHDLEMESDISGKQRSHLAESWDHTEPVDSGLQLSSEVYSHAEDETFWAMGWDDAGNRIQKHDHSISGKDLLMILEAGAAAHYIFPQNAKSLIIPFPGVDERGAQFKQRHGFTYQHVAPTEGSLQVSDVLHPGVEADEHVEQTAEWLNAQVEEIAGESAERVTVRLK